MNSQHSVSSERRTSCRACLEGALCYLQADCVDLATKHHKQTTRPHANAVTEHLPLLEKHSSAELHIPTAMSVGKVKEYTVFLIVVKYFTFGV